MLRLDRAIFFSNVRTAPFPGKLTQRQVDGLTDLLDAWEKFGSDDPRHLAYALATSFHETGGKMQPVREGFATSDKAARAYVQKQYGHKGPKWYCWPTGPNGQVYYGRGDVQLTWFENYKRMGEILDLPLAENPDLALQGPISKRILIEGLLEGASHRGDFTGKSLSDFFNETTDDPYGARQTVNGKDRATLISGIHHEFHKAVLAAQIVVAQPEIGPAAAHEPVEPARPRRVPRVSDQTSWGGGLMGAGGLAAAVGSALTKLEGPLLLGAIAVIVIGFVLFARGRKHLLDETGE